MNGYNFLLNYTLFNYERQFVCSKYGSGTFRIIFYKMIARFQKFAVYAGYAYLLTRFRHVSKCNYFQIVQIPLQLAKYFGPGRSMSQLGWLFAVVFLL